MAGRDPEPAGCSILVLGAVGHVRVGGGGLQGRDGTVLPVDERSFGHWNTNPYKLDQGGSGDREYDGAAYLLPYWMGVRLGLLD
jgi:hypothetical protein